MPKVCVIVPVYRVEAYLRRCVDSILNQSFGDFTLVLVDDGSPDTCGDICDEYAGKDRRIHVIHQKNGGLSAARNAGIEWCLSRGESEWLTFIDSDDWIHPAYLQTLVEAAEFGETRISACGFVLTEGEQPQAPPESMIFQKWDARRFYLEERVVATVAWAKLYHKTCFESIRYPVGRVHEDEYVTYRLLIENEVVTYVPAPLYGYFINPTGITRKPWSPKRLDALDAYEEQIRYFEERGDRELHCRCFREYMENAYRHLQAAEGAPNASELKSVLRALKRRMRRVIRRAAKYGYLEFRPDYEMLETFFPYATKVYEFWLEHFR